MPAAPLRHLRRCLCLPANPRGRDFVVGDLHGHRRLLDDVLHGIGFDPVRDRLFSVGDLVDRGPDSLGTLALLEEPWFHAVAGNHELMLLNHLGHYGSRRFDRKAFAHGPGAWVSEVVASRAAVLERLAQRVAALPLSIRVDDDVPFHVLHGDAVPLDSAPQALVSRPGIRVDRAEQVATSRRNLADASDAAWRLRAFGGVPVRLSDRPMAALPPTYVGHTRTPCITVHASHVYLEQGVGQRGHDGQPRPPTVVEHRAFARWLLASGIRPEGTGPGVATGRVAAG